eukprot:scaffold3250_cov105-Cylindrotheca_fusiformis.AAC.1
MTLRSLLPPPSQKITDGGANCHLTPPILQIYLQLLSFVSPVCVPYELYDTHAYTNVLGFCLTWSILQYTRTY